MNVEAPKKAVVSYFFIRLRAAITAPFLGALASHLAPLRAPALWGTLGGNLVKPRGAVLGGNVLGGATAPCQRGGTVPGA